MSDELTLAQIRIKELEAEVASLIEIAGDLRRQLAASDAAIREFFRAIRESVEEQDD